MKDISLTELIKNIKFSIEKIYSKAMLDLSENKFSVINFDAYFNEFALRKIIFDEINKIYPNENDSLVHLLIKQYYNKMTLNEINSSIDQKYILINIINPGELILMLKNKRKHKIINSTSQRLNNKILIKEKDLPLVQKLTQGKILNILLSYILETSKEYNEFSITSAKLEKETLKIGDIFMKNDDQYKNIEEMCQKLKKEHGLNFNYSNNIIRINKINNETKFNRVISKAKKIMEIIKS